MIDDEFEVEIHLSLMDAIKIDDCLYAAMIMIGGKGSKVAKQVRERFNKEIFRVLNIDSDMCCCGLMQLKEQLKEKE